MQRRAGEEDPNQLPGLGADDELSEGLCLCPQASFNALGEPDLDDAQDLGGGWIPWVCFLLQGLGRECQRLLCRFSLIRPHDGVVDPFQREPDRGGKELSRRGDQVREPDRLRVFPSKLFAREQELQGGRPDESR